MARISVVCPTYNSSGFIENTLRTLVDQTRKPDEVIISDDGSSDNTIELVKRFFQANGDGISWKILSNAHGGPGNARNIGIANAEGNWIAFLDSDDLWHPEKLKTVEETILAHPQANFVCHEEERVQRNGQTKRLTYLTRFHPERPLPPQLYFGNMFSTSAVVCLKYLMSTYGVFDETLMSAQDYELWLRLSPHIKPVLIPTVLGRYVERAGNITSGKLYWRMRNELRIAVMHRNLASLPLLMGRIGRILLSYSRQYVLRGLRHIPWVNSDRTGNGRSTPDNGVERLNSLP